MSELGSIDVLAGRYRLLATSEFAGYTTLYERLAMGMVDDPEALTLVASLCDPNQLPVRLFACVHELTLADPDLALAAIYRLAGRGEPYPDPWPAFRSLLFDRVDDLTELLDTRSIQTNEVGRAAALIPAFTEIQRAFGDRPLALVEIGPSAGLNLVADHYRIDYADGRSTGPVDAGLTLHCDTVGPDVPPLPTPAAPLRIASRLGIDISPIDVTDPDACRWLEACVWPDMADRADRLRRAIAIARLDPPAIVGGNALDLVVSTIDDLPADVVPVVVSTWVLAYFSKPDRLRLFELLDELGSRRSIALLTAEYPAVAPWVEPPNRAPDVEEGKGATLLALATWRDGVRHTRPLAWMQAHGLWIDWMDNPT